MKGWKDETPLYEDDKLKICYYLESPEDHLLYIKTEKEDLQFIIQRGILKSLAESPPGGLVQKINTFSPALIHTAKMEGIHPKEIHDAIKKAYAEQENRYEKWREENKNEFEF